MPRRVWVITSGSITGLASPANFDAVLTNETWEKACGKFPTQPPGNGVVLLGEQAEIVAHLQQAIEELPGIVVPADHGEAVGQPERAS